MTVEIATVSKEKNKRHNRAASSPLEHGFSPGRKTAGRVGDGAGKCRAGITGCAEGFRNSPFHALLPLRRRSPTTSAGALRTNDSEAKLARSLTDFRGHLIISPSSRFRSGRGVHHAFAGKNYHANFW